MVFKSTEEMRSVSSLSANRRKEILQGLVPVASCAANSQLDAFTIRLADTLMAFSDQCTDPKQANLSFIGANLLKKNGYAFYYLASVRLEELLRQEVQSVQQRAVPSISDIGDTPLSLVPYSEMDTKVILGNLSKPIDQKHAEQLEALGIRLASLLERHELPLSQNPFRPEVFLRALNDAWSEFDPDAESHSLVLPLLRPEVALDMTPILQALNDSLIAHGILPSLTDSFRIKKSSSAAEAAQKEESVNPNVTEELRRIFTGNIGGAGSGGVGGSAGGGGGNGSGLGAAAGDPAALQATLQNHMLQMTAVSNQLLGFLAGMQKTMLDQQIAGLASSQPLSTAILSNIKKEAPAGALTQVDEKTIDLLSGVFDMVFHDQNIATEMKALIGFLQVPVLKAALLDKEFFFKAEHPARRLVEMLTKSSLAWDQKKGQEDPLYQMVKRIVERVQQEFDQELSIFSDVVKDFDSYIKEEEAATTQALDAPINDALKREKMGEATKAAKSEVAMRVGTGEVVAFVETFLENKWVPVLTIAYSLQDEKPQAVQSAITTMDDLIWSVKPKITPEQRKELIAKLPSILSRLNKWLNIVKWEEADRLQFFAELAECHASIVRAPIPLTPEKQLELAVEVAKKAAERRLEKAAAAPPEPVPDEFDDKIKKLERGTWLNFTQPDGQVRKAKLSWASPMRSLFIFTTNKKEETFQLTDEELAQRFRDNTVQAVLVDGLVDRALTKAFAPGANDPKILQKTAA